MNLKSLPKALVVLTFLVTAVSAYSQSDLVLTTVNGSKIVISQLELKTSIGFQQYFCVQFI